MSLADSVNIYFFHGYEPLARNLFYRMHQAGLYGPERQVFVPGWWKQDWFAAGDSGDITSGKEEKIKDAAHGMVGLSTNVQLNNEKYEAWKSAFVAYQETLGDWDESVEPIYHVYLAHDAVYALAHALDKVVEDGLAANEPYWEDGDKILEALRAVEVRPPPPLSPPYRPLTPPPHTVRRRRLRADQV